MKAQTPKRPLVTPQQLKRLSWKQMRAIVELIEAEELRRYTAKLHRAGPSHRLTAEEARAERMKLSTAGYYLKRQIDAMHRRQHELYTRQYDLDNAIQRLHIEPLIGEFVSITSARNDAARNQNGTYSSNAPRAGRVWLLNRSGLKATPRFDHDTAGGSIHAP